MQTTQVLGKLLTTKLLTVEDSSHETPATTTTTLCADPFKRTNSVKTQKKAYYANSEAAEQHMQNLSGETIRNDR